MAESKGPEVSIANPTINGGATGLVQDEVIARLVPEPADPPDVIALKGFLGRSPRPRFWRLYQTLDLKDYTEIAEADIVHSESLVTKLQPLGGTVLWVNSVARLQRTRSQSSFAESELMQGDIANKGPDPTPFAANLNLSKSNVSRVRITIDGGRGDDEGDWTRCCPCHIHRRL